MEDTKSTLGHIDAIPADKETLFFKRTALSSRVKRDVCNSIVQ